MNLCKYAWFKITIITFVSLLMFSHCDVNNSDDCNITKEPLTQDNLITSQADFSYCGIVAYRNEKRFELFYTTGTCTERPITEWELPRNTRISYTGNASGTMKGFQFANSGMVCATLLGENGQKSERICRSVEVIKNNVWGISDNYPGRGAGVVMNLNNTLYSGFGNYNEWFRFDTLTWEWTELENVPGIANLKAHAGFGIQNKAYLLAANSQVYRYDPDADSWQHYDTLPALFFDDVMNEGIDGYLQYPLVGLSANGIGYYGIGTTGNFYSYDPDVKQWTKLPSFPERVDKHKHVFLLDDKIYVGKYYFDTNTAQWEQSPYNFSLPYGGPFVFDDEVYFGRGNRTYKFDGETLEKIELGKVVNACNPVWPREGFIGESASIGSIALIPEALKVNTHFDGMIFYKK
mgnify:CR=1 FL=1